ncbi:MAG: flippase-like domain-containing protein [Bacteroidetes bacterium]|nr:flippase-like domain-containing protein [Bacteroidota bacterium]
MKLLIALLLAWAIYRQVFARENGADLWRAFVVHFKHPNLLWLAAVLLLAPLNLALEAIKWRQLIRGFSKLGFWRTFQAVLAGTTIAIFTPNRVGEYGGRVLFVEQGQGWKAVIATIVGSLAQMLAIFSVGLPGAACFSLKFMEPGPYVVPVVVSLGLAFVGLLFFSYFNIDIVVPLARRIPYIDRFKKYLRHLAVLRHYRRRELGRSLGFAYLRYFTYATQYYLLLQFYGIPVGWVDGMTGIAAIFLVQASVPLPPVMGLLARGEIALFVWGFFTAAQADILAATFSLFVINIAVPALLGLACIVQVNIIKSLGYENGKSA